MSQTINTPKSHPTTAHPGGTPTSLFLLRHGEVEAAYQGVFGGRVDMELSPRGHEQAKALADYLRPFKFDGIYASPMKRVQQTLAPLLEQPDREAVITPDLREVDVGDWTGLNGRQVLAKYGISPSSWLEQLEAAAIPNGESDATFRARIEPCIQRMAQYHTGGRVAVACHGGVIRMILSILLGLPLGRMGGFEIDYASLTWIELQPHKNEVQLLNFTPWRDLP